MEEERQQKTPTRRRMDNIDLTHPGRHMVMVIDVTAHIPTITTTMAITAITAHTITNTTSTNLDHAAAGEELTRRPTITTASIERVQCMTLVPLAAAGAAGLRCSRRCLLQAWGAIPLQASTAMGLHPLLNQARL